uniref:Pept_C1 domain-containing protein n=1 Tax=Globodera pallida TaxID=36090 RepID=A0A183BJR6_GLOPA
MDGDCGSCWAFSANGAIEGAIARNNAASIVSLSEQNLLDCSTKYGNYGCDGGLMDNAFEYVKDNHGVDTENSYPYTGQTSQCNFNNKTVGATLKGFKDLPIGNEEQLKNAVATIGPISVGIDASHLSFQFYSAGVYLEKRCSHKYLDHAVLVVGYGTDKMHGDYWLVKNVRCTYCTTSVFLLFTFYIR